MIGARNVRALAAAALLTASASGSAMADGSAADGAALAAEYCSACHRTRADQPPPPPVMMEESTSQEAVQAPSFREIAGGPGRDAIYLRAIIEAPHAPMREQQFIPAELDAIIAYLLSLKDEPGTW